MHEKFFEIARSNMVKNQIIPNNVKDRELIDALFEIKKELFVPNKDLDLVYSDSDIFINNERNIIRTFVVAKMLDKCDFKKKIKKSTRESASHACCCTGGHTSCKQRG